MALLRSPSIILRKKIDVEAIRRETLEKLIACSTGQPPPTYHRKHRRFTPEHRRRASLFT